MPVAPRYLAAAALTAALLGSGILQAADPSPPEGSPAAASAAEPPAPETKPDAVVVKVNGVAITRAEVERAAKGLVIQNEIPAPTDAGQQAQVEQAAKDRLIASELLYQAAKDTAPPPDLEQQVQTQLGEIEAQFPSHAEFEQAMAEEGMTDAAMKELFRRDILVRAYIDSQIGSKIAVTPEQAKEFYDRNPDEFQTPETVHASHILVGVDANASPEEKRKAKEKAEGLLKQIKGGADFAELAKKESSCPSAKDGGDLGEIGRGQTVQPFEDAAFALKPGDLSEVVETEFGYHIVKSASKTEAGLVPFDEVKDQIEEHLKSQETRTRLAAMIAQLKKTATVETPAQP